MGYLELNRANWDERAPGHVRHYELGRYIAEPGYLSPVVRFDLPYLGHVDGQRGVHLQCHIGTDTVTLARLGAQMTGLDFSGVSLKIARDFAVAAGAEVAFVESDVYDAVEVLGPGGFDFVYTGTGSLCWLPDVARWAKVVAGLLRPGGRLCLTEDHPMRFAVAADEGKLVVEGPYFVAAGPVVVDSGSTYAGEEVVSANTVTMEWAHGIGEVVSALIEQGMDITLLAEHDSAAWDAFPGLMTEDELGRWRLSGQPMRLAASYTVVARRRSAGGN
ncbi:MAG TPA: class I SAM-dependent methyltransferase [Acidimicrobiales bacterium]|nr:class I SAM-dependent methyltransferase [Acidimicrobiales bacterium]